MFTYKDCLAEIELFCQNGVETGVIGESELGQRIPYVFVGKKCGRNMIVQGAIHGREHLTALLVVCLAKYLVKNSHLPLSGGIYLVPMANPDGVRICQEGVGWIENKDTKSNLIKINGGKDFRLWKANGQGVDVNVNFDARWGEGLRNEFCKSPQNYVGKYPFSTAEARALRDFTLKLNPCVTLSYHLKGEEIYWQFGQDLTEMYRDKKYAQGIANYTGYKLIGDKGSAGGYKDWCIQRLKIPSYTIEVGNDKLSHPFPYEQLPTILQQNADLPRRLLNTIVKDLEELYE